MVSKEIFELLENQKIGQLYSTFKICFTKVDEWSDIFLKGSLLDENELALAIDQNTGIHAKLAVVVNALESYFERKVNNTESKHYRSLEAIRAQDTSVAKSYARDSVADIRDYLGDFKGYLKAAEQNINSAQSRLKRLVVVKGARGVAFSGEVPTEEVDIPEPHENQQDVGW